MLSVLKVCSVTVQWEIIALLKYSEIKEAICCQELIQSAHAYNQAEFQRQKEAFRVNIRKLCVFFL